MASWPAQCQCTEFIKKKQPFIRTYIIGWVYISYDGFIYRTMGLYIIGWVYTSYDGFIYIIRCFIYHKMGLYIITWVYISYDGLYIIRWVYIS